MTGAELPHVLLVEDDANTRNAFRILFEASDYRVSEAESVADAVAVASADPPDVILLDLTLPDGDGLRLLERLRAAGRPTGIVLALTGHDDAQTAARCRAAGCTDVLVKPVPIRTLIRRVGELLG